jgi:Ca2+-binding RTX toxin-like protein
MSGTGITNVLSGTITDAKFSPDGSTMYVASGRFVRLVDVATGSVVHTYDLGQTIGALDVSVDGNTLVVAAKNALTIDGETSVAFFTIDLTAETVDQTQFTLFDEIPQLPYDLAFLASGKVLVSFESNSTLHLFDPAAGSIDSTGVAPYGGRANLIDSADGTTVYIVGSNLQQATFVYTDGVGITATDIRLPDPYAGASVPPPLSGAAAISSDGSLILSADRSIVLNASLANVANIDVRTFAGADIDEANNMLYLSLGNGVIAKVDLATGEAIGIYEIGKDIADQSSPASPGRKKFGDLVQVSADGSTLAVITVDGIVLLDLAAAVPVSTSGDDTITEGAQLFGLAGNDILGGDENGQDMRGGRGDDTYLLYQGGDSVYELAGEGHDKVFTNHQTYFLDQNVEDLEFVGAQGAWLVGNAADNTIIGGSGDDHLTGSFGDDVLNGGDGFDIAVYDYGSVGNVVDLALSGPPNTGAFGCDTLLNIEGLQGSVLGDTLSGDGKANLLKGEGGDDVLVGRGGNDTLLGGTGNDELFGGSGYDTLEGGEGQDVLDGGLGADTMIGGAHDDSYVFDHANDTAVELEHGGIDTVTSSVNIFALDDFVENLVLAGFATQGTGNALDNAITAGTSGVTLNGLAGDDTLQGNDLVNHLNGGTGNDHLFGGAGDDILVGGAGHDAFDGGPGADRYEGGEGDDIYLLDASDVVVERPNSGIDAIVATFENHTLAGNVEILFLDTGIVAGAGNILGNLIIGNESANLINGLGGDDLIFAGASDDIDVGQGGDDVLRGEDGNDALSGGVGDDDLYGGDGGDSLYGDAGNDRIWGQDGNDALYGGGLDDSLFGGAGDDFLRGDTGNDRVNGNAGNDTVNGDLGNDSVFGGGDNDRVYGGAGDDVLNGQAGDDVIVGGPGNDLLVGGFGADRFLFNPGHLGASLSATDRIKDFSSAQGDLIDLHNLDADTALAGNQAFAWIGGAAFSGTAGELRFSFAGNTTTITGDTNGDGAADFALWLTGQVPLQAGDFVL